MNTILLDTNIVSYLFKGDTRAAFYEPHILNRELAVAMMTVAELFQWAAARNWGQSRMRRLDETIQNYTILPVDIEACRMWPPCGFSEAQAGIRSHLKTLGSPQRRLVISFL